MVLRGGVAGYRLYRHIKDKKEGKKPSKKKRKRLSPDDGISKLVAALKNPDPEIRLEALGAINQSPDRNTAFPHVKERLFKDTDGRVRRHAAFILRKMNPEDVIPPLGEAALSDPNYVVRLFAFHSLIDTKHENAIPYLEKVALQDEREENRHGAMNGLAETFFKKAIPFLERVSNGPNPSDRTKAKELIAQIKAPESSTLDAETVEWIERLKNHPLPDMRCAMADGLGQTGNKAVIPYLGEAALHDTSEEVRGQAIYSLAQINHKDIVPYLEEVLKNSNLDPFYRKKAEAALKKAKFL